MKKETGLADLQAVLNTVFKKIDGAPNLEKCRIWDFWKEAVGPHIAQKARPEGIRNGILLVSVESSVWMQELGFLKEKILEKIHQKMGTSEIRDMRFKLGKIPENAHPDAAEALPKLDNEEQEKIEQQTASIEDKELRESLQSLFAAQMRRTKKKQLRTT
ncbi:MAG: DUF721 domain-containing protein [Proteobacteria bacterium]|nr:DUF721 domain-containing protein [Pseudomonadota bacterium]